MPSISLAAAVLLSCFALAPAPASAALTRDQQTCVATMNKGIDKLATAIGKETSGCIRDHNRGHGVTDLAQCIADDRKDKIAKAVARHLTNDAKKCRGSDNDGTPREPGVFYASGASIDTIVTAASELLTVIYGTPAGTAAITEATDLAAARCQERVAKRVQRCHRTRLAEFHRCTKSSLKSEQETASALTTCLTADSRQKIAKACDLVQGTTVDRIRKDLDKQCIGKGVDLSLSFPHCGSTDRDTVHECLAVPTACRTCSASNNASRLDADCDLLDNGASDGSCPDCALLGTCALVETLVAPAATDPAIDDPVGGDHLVYVNSSVAAHDELLVHLPGTFGVPTNNNVFLQAVADQGMKAIGLQYVNDGTVNGLCFNEWTNNPPPDPDCQESLRLERIYGLDTSPLENVSAANSLVNRLVKLLEYLHGQQPTVGWDAYLDSGQPRWDQIVFSGHSQGSGMAALLGRDHAVARVMMFGGPSDFDPSGNTAAWMTDPKATAISDHFGFRHQQDQLFPIMQTWSDMGLPGPPVLVDASVPPYASSRFLETNISVPAGDEHGSVIRNSQVEQGSAPTFKEVWAYMCCSAP